MGRGTCWGGGWPGSWGTNRSTPCTRRRWNCEPGRVDRGGGADVRGPGCGAGVRADEPLHREDGGPFWLHPAGRGRGRGNVAERGGEVPLADGGGGRAVRRVCEGGRVAHAGRVRE